MKKASRRNARTKIIATLGPASGNAKVLRKMFVNGLDVARLNFSHGTHAEHLKRIHLVRSLNKKMRRSVKIMQDLEGYRIRIGRFKGGDTRLLTEKKTVIFSNRTVPGEIETIPIDYEYDLNDIKNGSLIYIDDGNIILRAKSASKHLLRAVVIEGGVLKERKGVNIPELKIKLSGITDKDEKDLGFGIAHKMDYIAQSFVRSAKDVEHVKERVRPSLPKCLVVAKVENQDAIKNIDEIIDAADGIMVARGDMGISVPLYKIPMIQKRIIKKCNLKKKFVITATQMLESMTEHSRPTRAEVTDVANSILDGTDLVMLSAESAVGKYPAGSVKMMDQIIKYTESHLDKI